MSETDAARTAKDYSERLAQNDHFYAPLHTDMVAWLAIPPGSRVLDVGCGAGGCTAALAAVVGDAGEVIALDIAPAHLTATRTTLAATPYAGRATYREGSVDALPFADGQFDLVWCSNVVHGQPDRLATLRELRRVVKHGGRLTLREDLFWWRTLLPDDLGIGMPGLAARIAEQSIRAFYTWQRNLPGFVPSPQGWMGLLREADFSPIQPHTFVFEMVPPFSTQQEAMLQAHLDELRTDNELLQSMSAGDQHTIALITDESSAHYVLRRDSMYVVETATIYVAGVE